MAGAGRSPAWALASRIVPAASSTQADPRRLAPPPPRGVSLVLVGVLAAAGLFLLWELRFWLAVAFAAVVVGAAFRGGARMIERWTPLRDGAALTAFVFGLLGVFALFAWLLADRVVGQFAQLGEELPEAWDAAEGMIRSTALGRAALDQVQEVGGGGLGQIAGQAFTLGQSAVTLLTVALLVAVTGLYLAAAPDLYVRGAARLVPAARRERFCRMSMEAGEVLRRWVCAQILSMALLGVLTTLGLWLLGVPLFFALGLLTALLCFIPNLGPLLSVLPPVLLAMGESGSGGLVLGVLALYAGIQLFESYVSTPLIQEKAVRLPPALLIFGQVFAAALVGVLGLAVAAPLLAVLLRWFGPPEAPEADGDEA